MSAHIDTTPGVIERYVSAFERRKDLAGPGWLLARRQAALDAFVKKGLPKPGDEDWRFTNVTPITSTTFAEPEAVTEVRPEPCAAWQVKGLEGPVLVFVDGRFRPGASSMGLVSPGLTAGSLADLVAQPAVASALARERTFEGRPFAALNTALFEDAAVILVRDGAVIPGAVQVLYLSSDGATPTRSCPRTLIVAGRNSQVAVVETFAGLGEGRYFTNAVTEIVAAEGAVVDHYRLQTESDEAFHMGVTFAEVGRSASVSSHAVAVGSAIGRHDAVAVLTEEGADCTLNGFCYADASRLLDNHTEIDHATPHGTSHELYKGILADRARAVFNGRIRVRPDAQKTDAKQTNKTLLLSDNAQINTKPQLEIFANDVKCTHGATVGQLSAEALFYLRARGIGEEQARNMLVHAFASDVLNRMRLEAVRDAVEAQLAVRLPLTEGGELQ